MKWTLLYHRIHSHLVLLLNLTRFSPRKKIYNGVTKNLYRKTTVRFIPKKSQLITTPPPPEN